MRNINKRGEHPLFFLFITILPVIVGIIYFVVAVRVGNGELFYKQNMVEDLALSFDSLEVAPGDVRLRFMRDTSPYITLIGDRKAMLADDEPNDDNSMSKSVKQLSAPIVPRAVYKYREDYAAPLALTKDGPLIKLEKFAETCDRERNSEFCTNGLSKELEESLRNGIISKFEQCKQANQNSFVCYCAFMQTPLIPKNTFLDIRQTGERTSFQLSGEKSKQALTDTISLDVPSCLFDIDTRKEQEILSIHILHELQNEAVFSITDFDQQKEYPGAIFVKQNGKVCLLRHDPINRYRLYTETKQLENSDTGVVMRACG